MPSLFAFLFPLIFVRHMQCALKVATSNEKLCFLVPLFIFLVFLQISVLTQSYIPDPCSIHRYFLLWKNRQTLCIGQVNEIQERSRFFFRMKTKTGQQKLISEMVLFSFLCILLQDHAILHYHTIFRKWLWPVNVRIPFLAVLFNSSGTGCVLKREREKIGGM